MNSNIDILEDLEKRKKVLNVRRNQFDISGTLSYGLNVSLVHLSLFIMVTCLVKWPDIEKTIEFDNLHCDKE